MLIKRVLIATAQNENFFKTTINEKLVNVFKSTKQKALMRLYVDSNVFISLILEEVRFNRSLFSEAKSFFEKAKINEDLVVLSHLSISEIQKKCFIELEDLINLLTQFELNYDFVEDQKDGSKSILQKGIHYPDCIHANTAIKTSCNSLITFNKKDFNSISDLLAILEPQDY